jgi:hypothetical protein
MTRSQFTAFLFVAVAAVLVASPVMALALTEDPAAEGKVTAYEAGKTIVVGADAAKKDFKIDENTKIEGDLAVGKSVKVFAKDGVATKIVVKE